MEDDKKEEALEIGKIIDKRKFEIKSFDVKIVEEKRQKAIRIPQEITRFLKIDAKRDKFRFILNENEKTLKAELIQNEEESI